MRKIAKKEKRQSETATIVDDARIRQGRSMITPKTAMIVNDEIIHCERLKRNKCDSSEGWRRSSTPAEWRLLLFLLDVNVLQPSRQGMPQPIHGGSKIRPLACWFC